MRRITGIVAALLVVLALAAPVVAANALPHNGRVLVSLGGGIDLPADENVDLLVVGGGDGLIEGDASTVVILDGEATIRGATIETVIVINGRARLETGTTILGDVRTLQASVVRGEGAVVDGAIRGLETDLVGIGAVLAPALFLLFIGFALAAVLAALLLAALAARQVREATSLIRTDTGATILAGLAAIFLPPMVALVAVVTVVGIPAAIGLLVAVWPAWAFLGYLVAAIWIGDLIVTQLRGRPEAGRPYLAAVVGVLVLQAIWLVPFASGILSFAGTGAITLYAWRVFRGPRPQAAPPMAAPVPA